MRKFKYMKRKCLKRGKKATSLSLKNANESNALILFIKLAEIFFSNYSSQDEGKIGITFLESNLFGTFYDDALKERTGQLKTPVGIRVSVSSLKGNLAIYPMPSDLALPLLGIHLKETIGQMCKDTCSKYSLKFHLLM